MDKIMQVGLVAVGLIAAVYIYGFIMPEEG